MINKLIVTCFCFGLFSCGNGDEENIEASVESALTSNEVWPYEVTGKVDIIDAGVGDSDYAHWAIGVVAINEEEISIEFETEALRVADIDLDFNFSEPTTLLLGEPSDEYGYPLYPVLEIK